MSESTVVVSSPSDSTQLARRAATEEHLATRPGFDVATMQQADFEHGLVRVRTRQQRMQRILDEVMTDKVHYGNPNNAFPRPILLKAGAEELRTFFRFTLRRLDESRTVTKEYCEVVVRLGIFDSVGRLIAERSGACNTMEKRFEKRKGGGYTYLDAREKLHDCLTMAEKRAGTLLTCEATGASAFFANREGMDEALESAEGEVSPVWTDEERKRVYAAAREAGIATKIDMRNFVRDTLGRDRVETGDDVDQLLDALTVIREQSTAGHAP